MLKVHDTLRSHYFVQEVQDQNALRAVYQAVDKWNANRSVTINEFTVPPQDAPQFKRQLDALKTLNHISLPHVRDVFVQNGLHYLITDAVIGKPLSEQIKAGLPMSDAVRYIGQVADALAVCHSAGVIHRDVRPNNILISGGRAVLVNFGLMKLMLDDDAGTLPFIKGWGTPPYAAPELYGAGAGSDERSDIYALGATLYYALTRIEPVSVPQQKSGEPLPAPSRLVSGIPDHLEHTIEKAMRLDAADRFQSAVEFKQAASGMVKPVIQPQPIESLQSVSKPVSQPAARPAAFSSTIQTASVTKSPTRSVVDNGAGLASGSDVGMAEPAEAMNGVNRRIASNVPAWIKAGVAVLAVVVLVVVAVFAIRIVQNGNSASPLGPPVNADANVRVTVAIPTRAPIAPPTQTPVVTVQGQAMAESTPAVDAAPTNSVVESVPPVADATSLAPAWQEEQFSIGNSVQGRPLTAFKLGNGPIRRVLIGAIHGGYEWNTVDLMTEMLGYVRENPSLIPPQVTLYILPNANPDGYAFSKELAGRVNANQVDLNRNWDFNWQMTATHGTRPVFAGDVAFSEPESQAMRSWLEDQLKLQQPDDAVIFYHSAFTAIFAGAGTTNTLTTELAGVMKQATGYRILPGVAGQITTGDAIDYLTAKAGITAIEIELRNHQDIDWNENLRALKAFLSWRVPVTALPVAPATGDPQPATTRPAASQPLATKPPTSGCPNPYIVQSGDTLYSIAVKCGLSGYGRIMEANGISDDSEVLLPGRQLTIPAPIQN